MSPRERCKKQEKKFILDVWFDFSEGMQPPLQFRNIYIHSPPLFPLPNGQLFSHLGLVTFFPPTQSHPILLNPQNFCPLSPNLFLFPFSFCYSLSFSQLGISSSLFFPAIDSFGSSHKIRGETNLHSCFSRPMQSIPCDLSGFLPL